MRNTRKSPCRRWVIGKRIGGKIRVQRAIKVVAIGFLVAVFGQRAIKLTSLFLGYHIEFYLCGLSLFVVMRLVHRLW